MQKPTLSLVICTAFASALALGCRDKDDSKADAKPVKPVKALTGEWTLAQDIPFDGSYTAEEGKTVLFKMIPLFRFTKDSIANVVHCEVSVEGVKATLESIVERKTSGANEEYVIAEGGTHAASQLVNGILFKCDRAELLTGTYRGRHSGDILFLETPDQSSFMLKPYVLKQ